ncbi:hypothetical protein B484DRAFT_330880, partial [Ochromonadaceae sp. CCMP2298]
MQRDPSLVPTLTRAGYYCSPDISVLATFTSGELAQVKGFSVFRPNVGKIEWAGETDVRGLDLDRAVKIEHKEVFVYEEEAPPQGTGLNKPATVTLCRVFPKEGSTDRKRADFVHKLEDFCALNGAKMVLYSAATGDWVFAVDHFSRYGLDDSDDE